MIAQVRFASRTIISPLISPREMMLKSRNGSHGPRLQDILAAAGGTRWLGLKTRTATMMMTGADERELEDLKRRVAKVERRLITLAAFTMSTFGLWLALIVHQVFL